MAPDKAVFSGVSRRVRELSEDIRVAIEEFLERHPGTSSREIRLAMRLARRSGSGSTPRSPPGRRAQLLRILLNLGRLR